MPGMRQDMGDEELIYIVSYVKKHWSGSINFDEHLAVLILC